MVHQNASHQLRGDPKKLRSITPVGPLLIEYFQIQLVHEGCWLKCMLATFAPKIVDRQPVQLVVNEWYQAIEGTRIAFGPPFE